MATFATSCELITWSDASQNMTSTRLKKKKKLEQLKASLLKDKLLNWFHFPPWQPSGSSRLRLKKPCLQRSQRCPSTFSLQTHWPVRASHRPPSWDPDGSQSHAKIKIKIWVRSTAVSAELSLNRAFWTIKWQSYPGWLYLSLQHHCKRSSWIRIWPLMPLQNRLKRTSFFHLYNNAKIRPALRTENALKSFYRL